MFVCAAILQPISIVHSSLLLLTYVLKPPDDLVDVRGRILVELLIVAKDNNSDVDGTQDGQLVRLLEQAAFALEEGDAAVAVVSNCRSTMVSQGPSLKSRRGQWQEDGDTILGLISILRLPIFAASDIKKS